MLKRTKQFITTIDYQSLGKSSAEVFFLTLIALLPLAINIIIAAAGSDSISNSLKTKIIPGEMLSYCLSFLAPSLYLIIKIHRTNYKLPGIFCFGAFTFITYFSSALFLLIAKNHWDSNINMDIHPIDLYFKFTLLFLLISVLLRVYSVYHSIKAFNYSESKQIQEDDFSQNFRNSLNKK